MNNLKFFHFDQNNSGGYYVIDEKHGIGAEMIIQATSAKEAWSKLNEIGESNTSFHQFCQCCGERWSSYLDDKDGTDEPTIWGKPLSDPKTKPIFANEAFIHFADGHFDKHTWS